MSGVPLFPEAPGVERVSRAPSSPRSPARRSLFGPVDHELLARDFERSLRAMEEEKREKWNFDFRNYRPLPGPLQWKETDQAPEFYHRGHQHKSQRTESSPAESRAKKRSGEAAGESKCARGRAEPQAPLILNFTLLLLSSS
ncbi:cyclin-dependent kinase inhibitor 1B (p27, Kip1) S homeolog [Xenopus laevis]|uniref:Cyclin-dependent kinase inhibitor 1B n=1 Tax=Xenopus laevis TaxID=8355 RepID=Q5V9L8_XENLA|nr:cyclin-dependent kinase inhibitor 1B (p27, Kip1) S homeolog [Xenopus laevis]AAT88079.1 cyclin dependent kinase inhibitor p16Xic3 [Xenopus laevis]